MEPVENFLVGLPDSEILHLVTSISRELVCLHEADGTYIYVSPNSEKIIGYKSEELIGKNPYDYFHPEERRLIQERSHQPLLRGEDNIHTTFRFLHKNGSYIWLQSDNRLTIHPTTGQKYLHTSSRDISEKIDTEANLALAERRFKTLFHDSPIGLVITGKKGYIDETNDSFANFLGYKSYEIVGKHFSEISAGEELEENLKYRDEVQKGIIDNYSIEKQYLHKSGKKVWAYITVTVLRDEMGYPIHYLAQIIDINERKKSETLLLENNDRLRATTNSLLTQNKQLQAYNQIISHHLRAPVSNLRSLLDLMKETNDLKEIREIEDHLEVVTETLETVLSELISTLKIQNSDHYKPERVAIDQSFSNVIHLMEGELAEKQVEIQSDFSGGETIFFSKEFLETIFLNLLNNSLRYAQPGRNLRISVESFQIGAQTTISFSDNGSGIDLERYGDQIFQLRKTFHRHISGKGLGLFLIKYKMESVGGRIEVRSKPGEGATFLLHFPEGSETK
ncbi:sensor histidine kinase [Leptospira terpstrae]|uniref:histidine kinase n=1 Tax=Leptospira terpstrae serovar Hualin str. LT 11-33 = ATCC 700639 TaxID=1257025 RepID=N1VR39_9LEPT|nr:PAS domain-containing sensor histidine kinase [Leptospira terpstrae]EMY62194.1 PAS domain S-box protein [Leptospira terpstrae serovar Hualin str. LT 11-33 = ATCC 700639]